MRISYQYFTVLSMIGLIGCGGSDTGVGPVVVQPLTRNEANPPTQFSYFPAGNLSYVRVVAPTSLGNDYELTNVADGVDDIDSFRFSTSVSYVLRGTTPSGAGEFYIGQFDQQLSRLSETRLPDSGTATMNGTYGALYYRPGIAGVAGHIFGDVDLTVNADTGMVSGTIDERANSGGLPASDITLVMTPTSGGGFSGATMGGALNGFDTEDGGYTGGIVGANGTEAVGAVAIEHSQNGSVVFQEVGGFTVAD